MKNLLIALALAGAVTSFAADAKTDKKEKSKAKSYTLKTCIVTDEKLGGDMGDPYVFVHDGQEIKLCCKSCKKDFDKEPSKYLKKLSKK
jgi:hypothetical protein